MPEKSKKNVDSIATKLNLVIKSGKYTLGWNSTLKALRSGKAKLILVASNCPALRRSELEYNAALAKVRVHSYTGTNNDLGTACGRFFRVGVMTITDEGDSDILSL